MLVYPQAYGTITELVHHGMYEELFNVTEVSRSSHVIVSNIKTLVDTTLKKKIWKITLKVEWQRILPQIFRPNLCVLLGKAVNAENVFRKKGFL